VDLAPDRPFLERVPVPESVRGVDLRLALVHEGREVVGYQPEPEPADAEPPSPATEPPPPEAIASPDELYLTGLHLWQYRHATRSPLPYWTEALRRDPADSRVNTALGEWHLRRGALEVAERHLLAALARLTARNPNPRHGEASYLLGVVRRLRGDADGADEAFGKASWDGAFAAAALTARAELASARGDEDGAEELLARALGVQPEAPLAMALRAALARRAGDRDRAAGLVAALLAADPLDVRAVHEQALLGGTSGALPGGSQTALDIAHDEARAGLLDEAVDVIRRAIAAGPDRGTGPLLHYTLAWLLWRRAESGDAATGRAHLAAARGARPAWVMPARLEEVAVLRWAMSEDATDARAPYYLGNLLYDRRRYAEAIELWRRAARLDPSFPTVHRNLGIAEANILRRPGRALAAYRRAVAADPTDARLLYELDQLRKRLRHDPAARLRALRARLDLVEQRDDLSVEHVTLLDRMGRHEEAVAILAGRRFHPWEGGEGLVARQWVVAHRELGRAALRGGDAGRAATLIRAAMAYPPNLGEGKHLLTAENELQLLLGRALLAGSAAAEARGWLERAAEPQGDPDAPAGDGPYWQALALRELGRGAEAEARLRDLLRAARTQARAEVRIPYFATSLPTLLLFDDDLTLRSHQEARYLEGLGLLGLGRHRAARTRFTSLLEERPDHLEAALRLAEIGER
jgi:tetratricopeptide (TPR) repeat protein